MLGKNKFCNKIILIFLLLFVILSNLSIVMATSSDGDLLSRMQRDISSFSTQGSKQTIDLGAVTGDFKGLAQVLTMIGGGVMVAVTTYMGIKYLTAGPEAQAKLKIQLIGIVVSTIVIFGAYYIWSFIIKIASNF